MEAIGGVFLVQEQQQQLPPHPPTPVKPKPSQRGAQEQLKQRGAQEPQQKLRAPPPLARVKSGDNTGASSPVKAAAKAPR